MKAIVVTHNQPHSELSVTDTPDPKPGKDEVLVDIYCAGLNFFDSLQTQGKYQVKHKHPFILGSEFAGEISANSPLPQGCKWKPGDRVFGATSGGAYAERVAINWQMLLPIPNNVSFEQAAGLSLTWSTSYEGLVGRGELKAGEWVLIHAAAGGVGICAVQIAKALGAKVIATAGSPEKREVCKRLGGADYVVDYTDKAWPKEVLKITGGKGVDVVYDPVGLIRDSLKCIAWKGRAVVVGFAAGSIEQLPLNIVLLKNIAVVGLHWGAYLQHEPSRTEIVWKAIFDIIGSGKAMPLVYEHIFEGLNSVPEGIEAVVKRKTYGKAVVRIRKAKETAKL